MDGRLPAFDGVETWSASRSLARCRQGLRRIDEIMSDEVPVGGPTPESV
jgi:hypothetical protein